MTPTDSPYVAYFSLFVVLWGILFLRYVPMCCLCGVGVVHDLRLRCCIVVVVVVVVVVCVCVCVWFQVLGTHQQWPGVLVGHPWLGRP